MAAANGSGPLGFMKGDRDGQDAQLAKDLAAKLHGPSASQIQKALGQVRDERMAQRRKAEAAAIAAQLNGVSTDQVDKALQKLEQAGPPKPGQFRRFDRNGDGLAAQLAKQLNKSTAEVRKALQAARKKQFDAQIDQAVKNGRLTKAQAAKIKKSFQNGPRFGRGGFGHGGFRHGFDGDGPGRGGGPPPGAPGRPGAPGAGYAPQGPPPGGASL
jgi:biotin operon repressor